MDKDLQSVEINREKSLQTANSDRISRWTKKKESKKNALYNKTVFSCTTKEILKRKIQQKNKADISLLLNIIRESTESMKYYITYHGQGGNER